MRWFVLLLLTTTNAYAGSITPRFTTGQMESSSRSVSTIQESIVTENYRTGFSYTVQGHNIKTDSYISPDATYTTSQNTGHRRLEVQAPFKGYPLGRKYLFIWQQSTCR